jgi:hypothetical protein
MQTNVVIFLKIFHEDFVLSWYNMVKYLMYLSVRFKRKIPHTCERLGLWWCKRCRGWNILGFVQMVLLAALAISWKRLYSKALQCKYVRVCACACVCVCVCVYACMHACMYVCMYSSHRELCGKQIMQGTIMLLYTGEYSTCHGVLYLSYKTQ